MSAGSEGLSKPFMDSDASQSEMDYLHAVDWKKAEALVAAGTTREINDVR